ncbi:MAG: hypothetical protein JWR01_1567 [Subtercola sp.]|nr:hypothetical protein [Subtercola sp.]
MLAEPQGGALTLSSLANEAEVSRRTLYAHWGTIDKVVRDAVVSHYDGIDQADTSEMSSRQRLRSFLEDLRDGVGESATVAAIGLLLYKATQNEDGQAALEQMNLQRLNQFEATVCPVTEDQYCLIVGPIFTSQLLYRRPASDSVIATSVDLGMSILNLDG